MGKCLVTKLKGVVDNVEILKVGEIKIQINKISNPTAQTQNFSIATYSPVTLKIIGNGYFTDSSLTQNLGTEITTTSALISYYLSNGDYDLIITNKYDISYFIMSNINAVNKSNVDVSMFKYSPLKQLKLENFSTSIGDLSELSNLTYLNQLNLNSTLIKGDISSISNLTALALVILNSNLIHGDIQAFRNFINLKHLQIIDSPVEGNINTLSNLNYTYLCLKNTKIKIDLKDIRSTASVIVVSSSNISGDLNSLKDKVKVSSLEIYNTSATKMPFGNIELLKDMLNLEYVVLNNISSTGDLATLPPSCKRVSCSSSFTWGTRPTSSYILSLSQVSVDDVDKLLINQAQCKTGITSSSPVQYKLISIIGTRTSASDDAVATLQSKGYTVSIISND